MEGTFSDFSNFFVYKVGYREKNYLRSLSFLGPPRPELGASNVLTSALDLEFSNVHISFIFKDTYILFLTYDRFEHITKKLHVIGNFS